MKKYPLFDILIVLLFLASLVFGGVLTFLAKPVEKELGPTAFRVLYQFVLMALLGGGIAALYRTYENQRKEKREIELRKIEAKKESQIKNRILLKELRAMYAEILEAYQLAKTTRRELRAILGTRKSVENDKKISKETYAEKMSVLNKCQLVYEDFADRAEGDLYFVGQNTELRQLLRSSEKYLNKILKEYQDNFVQFKNEMTLPLKNLPKLREFIGPYDKNGDFATKLASTNDQILTVFSKLILK